MTCAIYVHFPPVCNVFPLHVLQHSTTINMNKEPKRTEHQEGGPDLSLLGDDIASEVDNPANNHAFKTAPVFTGDAYNLVGCECLPQKALYGRLFEQNGMDQSSKITSPTLYINTNTPFSALICGVQGSGKSHSTSVLLESALIDDRRIGTLPAPLSAIVFHFDTAAGGGLVQPCEAAYLSSINRTLKNEIRPPEVTVLVVPTYLSTMKKVYAKLPHVRVEPLLFSPEDISGERLLSMMKVDENTQMPLYMEAIMLILRSMEDSFDYAEFRDQLKQQKFNPSQKAMLNLRLSLLDSCMKGGNSTNGASNHFRPGQLTIIDLSSPFMDAGSACGFFDIILGLFIEVNLLCGKLVVLDEAHKYLSESQGGSSARLTDSLLTVIRQQRHLATRVVISTQEPTVVPTKFLDLCSFIIAHRFSSPKWLKILAEHVSAADSSLNNLYNKIVSLRTGEAIMFAPNGLVVRDSPPPASATAQAETGAGPNRTPDSSRPSSTVTPLGQGYFFVRSRLRVSRDGGHSVLAVNDPATSTRFGRDPAIDTGPQSDSSTLAGTPSPAARSADTTKAGVTPTPAHPQCDSLDDSDAESDHFVDAPADPVHIASEPPVVAEETGVRASSAPLASRDAPSVPPGIPSSAVPPILPSVAATQAPSPANPSRTSQFAASLLESSRAEIIQPYISHPDSPVDVKALFSRLVSESYPVDDALYRVGRESAMAVPASHAITVIRLEGSRARFAALVHFLQTSLLQKYYVVPFSRVRVHFYHLLEERGIPDPSIFKFELIQYVQAAIDEGIVLRTGTKPSIKGTLQLLVENATYSHNDSQRSNGQAIIDGAPTTTAAGRGFTTPTVAASATSVGIEGVVGNVVGSVASSSAVPSGWYSSASPQWATGPSNVPPPVLATSFANVAAPSSNVIRLTGPNVRYAPLLKYVKGIYDPSRTHPRLGTVIKHFTTKETAHYGSDPAVVQDVVAGASQRGLLTCGLENTKSPVKVLEGATYVFT